ncbi:MAG: YdhR family protein [Rhodobacteraceae bacterium]|nr:YdhR family protein [Paracoccaceae bacterium]
MTPALLTVAYRLQIPSERFRTHARSVADQIAEAPGLVWKIWGLDPDSGQGTSVYLFRDAASASAFATGPVIAGLRNGPARDVITRISPVEAGLSTITGAAPALM